MTPLYITWYLLIFIVSLIVIHESLIGFVIVGIIGLGMIPIIEKVEVIRDERRG